VQIDDLVHLGAVDMTVRKMVQQIVERKKAQLFFQQIGPLRPYSFEVFDGVRQYVFDYGYLKMFSAKVNGAAAETHLIT
jgi:hypothetical protein